MEDKRPTCVGMILFGATAEYLHHCNVDVYAGVRERVTISIEPRGRERDVPVQLRLDREEAQRLLERLTEVLQLDATSVSG